MPSPWLAWPPFWLFCALLFYQRPSGEHQLIIPFEKTLNPKQYKKSRPENSHPHLFTSHEVSFRNPHHSSFIHISRHFHSWKPKCSRFESAFNIYFFCFEWKRRRFFIFRMLFPPVAFHTHYSRINFALVSTSHQGKKRQIVPKRLLTVTDALWWWSSLSPLSTARLSFAIHHSLFAYVHSERNGDGCTQNPTTEIE